MNIRLLTLAILIICVVCVCAPLQGAVTQIPKLRSVPYERWGFQVDVPHTSRRVALPAKDDVELWHLHFHGDFVYFVKVVKVTNETLTSTAIEQDIQAESNCQTRRGATKRWEMDSRDGELFKGLNYFTRPDEDIPEAAVELQKALRGRTGYVSCAWAPLKGESGPMLIVGVIGPKGRDDEVDNLEKFFARGVRKAKSAVATTAKVAVPSSVPKPPPVVPKPASPTVQPVAKLVPALNKGDIQITGVVESITADKKCLTMKAEEIMLPGSASVKLTPPRQKIVNLNKPAESIAAGDRIVIVGKNTGVGKPIAADALTKAP